VRPDFISLQNEPDFTAVWSTCLFGPTEGIDAARGISVAGYDQALDAVYSHVQALAPVPLLLGPEISGIGGKKLQNYLGHMNPDHFAVVAHHLYNGGMPTAPETYNAAMRIAAGLAPDKPLFMTEFAPMPQDMFATAWLMNNAVTVEGVSAYIYWDLTWDAPGGLVTTENPYDRSSWKTDKGYAVRDPYYAVKHFARWVDCGWTRVAATASTTAVKVSAFVSPDGSQTTVVLLNTGATARDVTLTTGDWTYANSDVFRTSSSADLTERTAELGPLPADGMITLPPLGIATITLTE
jgi:O-glycosyl hydrolase